MSIKRPDKNVYIEIDYYSIYENPKITKLTVQMTPQNSLELVRFVAIITLNKNYQS